MSVFLDELKSLKMYVNDFYYPIDDNDRYKNSMIYLMTPNRKSSINVINHNKTYRNKNVFKSYYLDKNVDLVINAKSSTNESTLINEEVIELDYDTNKILSVNEDNVFDFSNDILKMNSDRIYLSEDVDSWLSEENDILNEDKYSTRFGTYNLPSIFRKILYNERIKTQKEVLTIYEDIKKQSPSIKFTFVDPKLYKNRNLYYDWSYYTELFFKNNTFTSDKGLDIYYSFLNRFLEDFRFDKYTYKTIVIPVNDWIPSDIKSEGLDYKKHINPISMMYRHFKIDPQRYTKWASFNMVLLGNNSYVPIRLNEFLQKPDWTKFAQIVTKLINNNIEDAIEIKTDSKKSIVVQLVDKFEKSGIKLDDISVQSFADTGTEITKEKIISDIAQSDNIELKKAALVNHIHDVAAKSDNIDDALENMGDASNETEEENENLKNIMLDLQSDDGIKMDKVRAARHDKTQADLMNKEIKGTTIKKLLDNFQEDNSMPEMKIPVESIDDSWEHLKFPNFNKMYSQKDMDADIVAMFNHFTTVTHPMNLLKLDYENTSTSEDYINTWTANYEDAENGKRFTMKLDMPLLISNRFMRLRGNEKVLLGQLMLLPIIKTNEAEVQMVSNYNKIFIRRKSPSGLGKTTPIINKLCKVLSKYQGKTIKIHTGDNTKVCSRYELPIAFIDIASLFSSIEFKDRSKLSFNMDELSKIPFESSMLSLIDKKLTLEELNKKYLGIYINSNGKREPISNKDSGKIDQYILDLLCTKDETFVDLYNQTAVTKRLMYSEASILNMVIPVVVLLSYNIGLRKVMDKAGIKYTISDKRPSKGKNYIVFSDGYIEYESNEEQNMLMNGIMQVDTKQYSITEIDSKDMWLSVLDEFGGRIKADGLDNFYDLMMDPITIEICKSIKIPHTYVEGMLYANNLLVDNKYNRHSDITGNRLRINEIIVGHLYHVLATAFGSYRNMVKRNKGSASFSAKQSAVIDSIMNHDQTSSDLSTLTPLLEAESAAKVTFKGLSGMNSDRAFSIDKRTFDQTMLGVVGLSTGFAASVGINRQLTIDSGIRSKRGFISPRKPKDLNNVNTLSMMECLSPMALNHDDPFRTAMAFTQTAQHQMTVKKSMPMLVSAGADEALPYLTSNKFSYKFEGEKGTVIDMTDDYIVVQDDKTKQCYYVDIRETIRKNSDGGFYITTKLTPNSYIKKGAKVKKNDIIAYDKANYSNAIGNGDNKNPNHISYNLGTIAKVAIMNTDLGFEDSCVVDTYISEALSSKLCFQKEINLDKNSNVYNLVEIGDEVQADDPLLIFQDAFDEKEANDLLRMVSMDQDEISDLGRKHIRSKVAGVVQDIKIFRTCDIDKLSPTLQKIVKAYENKIDKLKKVMGKYGVNEQYTLEPTKKLPAEGKLKNLDGVRIEIYIKTDDIFSCGDKLVFYQALKGVCSYLIPKGKEAYTDFRPKESVNSFLTINGVMGRMVPSALTLGLTFKTIIELTRQCQEELGIKWRQLQEILVDNN